MDNSGLLVAYVYVSLLFFVTKFVACGGAVASGGSGGVFAPALVLGAAFGCFYGSLVALINDDPV